MDTGEGNDKDLINKNNLLVLSIDENGRIRYFNKECEKHAGYLKDEVFNKKMSELIPDDHKNEWFKIFDDVKNQQVISDLKIPLLTSKGNEIMALWDVASIEDSDIGSIGLVGYPLRGEKNSKKVVFSIGNKKIFFKNPLNPKNKSNEKKSNAKMDKKPHKETSSNKKSSEAESSSKDDIINKILKNYDPKNLEENFKNLDKNIKVLKEIEKRNEKLEEENKELREKIEEIEKNLEKSLNKIKYLENKHDSLIRSTKDFAKNSVGFIFDVVGGKKKKEEFDSMMNQLGERQDALKILEDSLNEQKINLNESVDEFVEWREKLENLEGEIQKRREVLVNREQNVKDNLLSYVDQGICSKSDEVLNSSSKVEEDSSELIEDLEHSAVILQRGILKKVNTLFTDLIGLNEDSLLEKSFFDFISTDGLTTVEAYYLKRLKGEEFSSYETILVTGDKKEVKVEINVKPVMFKGTKADMLVFNSSGDTHESPVESGESVKDSCEIIEDGRDQETQNSDEQVESEVYSNSAGKTSQDDISSMFEKSNDEKKED